MRVKCVFYMQFLNDLQLNKQKVSKLGSRNSHFHKSALDGVYN